MKTLRNFLNFMLRYSYLDMELDRLSQYRTGEVREIMKAILVEVFEYFKTVKKKSITLPKKNYMTTWKHE